ncbi:MAG: hypothetical protein ACYTFW_09630 [Planctomycetota bacterium]|jgi:hypothetical protein
MSEESNTQEKARKTFHKKTVIIVICIAISIAVICFTTVAILPPPEGSLLKNPLRSLLTGLGLLGIACPLCIAGLLPKKQPISSPYYFEEAFIKKVFNIFGFVCFILSLICIGFSIYASVKWVLGSG